MFADVPTATQLTPYRALRSFKNRETSLNPPLMTTFNGQHATECHLNPPKWVTSLTRSCNKTRHRVVKEDSTLQDNTDPRTKILVLPVHLIERINRYTFDYGQAGWEHTLKRIFLRALGDGLDQIPQ